MKKKVIVVSTAVAVILIGISLIWLLSHSFEESEGKQQSSIAESGDIESVLSANRELLLKYTDTPSNFAITLLGLDGLVGDIRKAASVGLDLTDKCAELIDRLEGSTDYQGLLDFNVRFLECNAKTLEVKENRDVGSFESALSNTLSTISEYNAFLEELNENKGG